MTRKADRLPRIAIAALSVLGLVGLWSVLALLNGDTATLPGPWDVFPLAVREITSGELPRHLAATLRRVAVAFVLAMAIGIAIGLVLGRSDTADRWFDPWLIAALNLPALVTIVLCYLWIGLNEVAAVAAVAINKIPNVVVTIREGTRALDRQLDDMAEVFGMPPGARFRNIILPQLWPYVAAAARSGVALIWKIVLVVEFLGRSDGVGFKIHLYFQLFEVGMVLAYALCFIVVMLLIETIVLRPMEARVNAWREQ